MRSKAIYHAPLGLSTHRPIIQTKPDHLEKLMHNLDKVFSLYIRKRDYVCPMTGENKHLTKFFLYDIIEYPNVRWDERCCFTLHEKAVEEFKHKNPFKLLEWYTKRYTPEGVERIRAYAEGKKKIWTVPIIIEMTNDFVKRTEELPEPIWSNGRGRKRDT